MTTDSILIVLLVQSARTAVLILAILLLRMVLGKRIPPAWRHAIWGLVPLQLLLVVSIPSSISFLNIARSLEFNEPEVKRSVTSGPAAKNANFSNGENKEPDVKRSVTSGPVGASVEFEVVSLELNAGNEIQPMDFPSQNSTPIENDPEVALRSTPGSLNFPKVLFAVWSVGCVVMITIFTRQILMCRRWLKCGKPVTREPVLQLFEECCRQMNIKTWLVVAQSETIRSPFLIGAVRPKLLLPRRMVETASTKQLQAVFLHELAHLKRWDIWTGWLMTMLLIVHWFNPLLWIAIRRMNADREEACDVMAMNRLDRTEQGDYAYSLLEIARQFAGPTHAPGLVGISETGKFLKRRIEMLKQIGTWKLRWKVLAVGLAMLIAAVTLTDAQEKKPAKDQTSQTVDQLQAEVERLQAEVERLRKDNPPNSLNNNRKLFTELLGIYTSDTENREVVMTFADKDNAILDSAGENGVRIREKYQPKNPDAAFVAMVIVRAKNQGTNLPDIYTGEVSFVDENKLKIAFNRSNDKPFPESLSSVTAEIIREDGGITLVIPKTQVWDEIRVTKPSPKTTFDKDELPHTQIPPEETAAPDNGQPRAYPPHYLKAKTSMVRQDIDNMKQLGLALHNYHDVFRSLPSASTADKDGKPMHSWRMTLLPYLGQQELYAKIRHNEPWDSEYNRQFHNQMPDVYRTPSMTGDNEKNGNTFYAVVVGDRKADGTEGNLQKILSEPVFAGPNHWAGMGRVMDGTSNTVAFVMRARPVCWMDPNSDIPFDVAMQGINANPNGIGAQNVPELSDKPLTPMAFCDGSVQLLSAYLPRQNLRAMLTCNGGESVSWDDWLVDPEPKTTVVYELPPSADADRVLKMFGALVDDNENDMSRLSPDKKKITIHGRESAHEKIKMLLDMFKSPPPVGIQRKEMAYRLLNVNAVEVAKNIQPLLPNAVIKPENDTNSLLVSAPPEEFETIRKMIEMMDQAPAKQNEIPTLRMKLAGPDEVEQGKEETYRLHLTNVGKSDLKDLKMTLIHNGEVKGETSIPEIKRGEDRILDLFIAPLEKDENVTLEIRVEVAGRTGTLKRTIKVVDPDVFTVAVYKIAHVDAQIVLNVLQTVLKDSPDVRLSFDARTNSVIAVGKKPDHEKIREIVETFSPPASPETQSPYGNPPSQVNPGVASAPQPIPVAPDPIVGRYLAVTEADERMGIELTRTGENDVFAQGWPIPNQSPPAPKYRVVMYHGGLPGDGYEEGMPREIGSATLDGSRLNITLELVHDGKRYLTIPETNMTWKLLLDGDATLLVVGEEGDSKPTIAVKVKDKKTAEIQAQSYR